MVTQQNKVPGRDCGAQRHAGLSKHVWARKPSVPAALGLVRVVLCMALWVVLHQGAAAERPLTAEDEGKVKARLLLVLALETEWPPAAFASDSAPLVVGILGKGPVADA